MTGPEIREARKAAGVKQKDLADQLGIRGEHLSRVENGAREVTPMMSIAVCATLQCASLRGLTADERRVVDCLADAWNAFLDLPSEHPDDLGEFRFAIHAAQRIILSRPACHAERVSARRN